MTEKSRKVNESQIDFLKPCPFCDNADDDMLSVFDDKDYIKKHRWYVYCHECGAQGPRAGSEKDAIDRWNKEVKE